MIRVEKILFPGIVAGCLFLVMVTSLISRPVITVSASIAAGPQIAAAIPTAVTAGAAVVDQPLPIVPIVSAEVETAPVEQSAPEAAAAAPEAAVEQPAPAGAVVQVDMPADQAQATPSDEEMREGGSSTCSVSQAYPESIQQWCGSITAAAQQHGLDPNLIAAVMLQESGGSADAYSKSGAVGLMQVMPRDGLAAGFMCINGPCFSARPSMDELFDPEYNIAYGVRMLAGLIQKHGGPRDALRAYGPMNMGYYYADIVLGIYNRYQ
jgi:soluble lytic murein transglycosylase-like protein